MPSAIGVLRAALDALSHITLHVIWLTLASVVLTVLVGIEIFLVGRRLARRLLFPPLIATIAEGNTVQVEVGPSADVSIASVTWYQHSGIQARARLQASGGVRELLAGTNAGIEIRSDTEKFALEFSPWTLQSGSASVDITISVKRPRIPFASTISMRHTAQFNAPAIETAPVSQPVSVSKTDTHSPEKNQVDSSLVLTEGSISGDDSTPRGEGTLSQRGPSTAEALLVLANTLIGTPGVSRSEVRSLLTKKNIEASIYTPYNVPESASLVFTKYWFDEDARTGSWLWARAEDGNEFLAVPFDLRDYDREATLSYLGSLFNGVFGEEEAIREGGVRVSAAARLIPTSDGAYTLKSLGTLASTGAATGSRPPSAGVDDRIARLNGDVKELKKVVESIKESPGGDRRLINAVVTRTDDLSTRVSNMESFQRDLSVRIDSLFAEVRQLAARAPESAKRKSSPEAVSPPADVAKSHALMEPVKPAPAIAPVAPRLPEGWDEALRRARVEGNFSDGATYAASVVAAHRALTSLATTDGGAGTPQIVHLLRSSGDGRETSYIVHFTDTFVDETGTTVLRCVDNPGARTPAQQFFLAFSHQNALDLAVLCPVGEYSPLFNFFSLAENLPREPFKVTAVEAAAHLRRGSDGLFRVLSPLKLFIG